MFPFNPDAEVPADDVLEEFDEIMQEDNLSQEDEE